jgi:hypothetical protein
MMSECGFEKPCREAGLFVDRAEGMNKDNRMRMPEAENEPLARCERWGGLLMASLKQELLLIDSE